MENDYVQFLTDLRDVNMDALSQIQRRVVDGDEIRLEPWLGNGRCQINEYDVTSFFGPVAKAILESITSHDYVQVAVVKMGSISYIQLKTHTTIFKITANFDEIFEYDFCIDAMATDSENSYYFASDKYFDPTSGMQKIIQDLTQQKTTFDDNKKRLGEIDAH